MSEPMAAGTAARDETCCDRCDLLSGLGGLQCRRRVQHPVRGHRGRKDDRAQRHAQRDVLRAGQAHRRAATSNGAPKPSAS